jgi:hypothetical protein
VKGVHWLHRNSIGPKLQHVWLVIYSFKYTQIFLKGQKYENGELAT